MPELSPSILIVDDEVDTCANLSDILCDLGFRVDTAFDGLSALTLVRNNRYDMALLDLRMPGMDGLELYRQIKQISAGTVALIVTAYATSETAKSALAAGARRLISKPVDIQHLLSLVDEAVESPLVLVIDDDGELCDNLWDILHERGFRVHMANDVEQASLVLQRHHFQVVLLDMKLPGGEGFDMLGVIKETNPRARTVVITGYPDEMGGRVHQALEEGASAVAYKPFDVGHLLQIVTDLSKSSKRDNA